MKRLFTPIFGNARILPSLLFFVAILFVTSRTLDGYLILITSLFFLYLLLIKQLHDTQSFILLIFSSLYILISYINGVLPGNTYIIGILICPSLYYLYGKYMYINRTSDNQIILFLLVISTIFLAYTFYYTIIDIEYTGIINPQRRFNFLDPDSTVAATLNGVISSLGLCGIGFLFFTKNDLDRKMRISLITTALCSILINIHLVNRTAILAIILIVITGAFYYNKKNFAKIVLFIIFLFLLLFTIIKLNIIDTNILDAYETRNEGESDIKGGGGRFERWGIAIQYMIQYPFGFSHMSHDFYAHNLWLDSARNAGIFPFLLLVIFFIKSIRSYASVYKKSNSALGYYLLSLYNCCTIYCMGEPIIEALPLFFYLYCFISGLLNSYNDSLNLSKV